MCKKIRHLVEVVRTIRFTQVLNGISLPFGQYTDQHFLEPNGQIT